MTAPRLKPLCGAYPLIPETETAHGRYRHGRRRRLTTFAMSLLAIYLVVAALRLGSMLPGWYQRQVSVWAC